MTDFPEDLFSQVYKRAPNDQDRERLLSVKAALGLSSRDEMWPVILVFDHYDRAIRAARSATVKEVKDLLEELQGIPDRAGPIASAEAQKAIHKLIGEASEKIAKASAEKSVTTADRISKRQFIVAAISGGLITVAVAVAAAAAAYFVLDARGICSEAPGKTRDGSVACIVERGSG